MCQSEIHMNGWTQGFPAEHCPGRHTASAGFPSFLVLLGAISSQVSGAHAHGPGHLHGVKEKRDSSDQATFFHCFMVQL